VIGAGWIGGLSGAAYGLLNGQSRRAQSIISVGRALPLNADGVYLPDGSGPHSVLRDTHTRSDSQALPEAMSFAVLGDSLAAGVGAETGDRLPGVLLAKGLAEESGRPVRLTTQAISGAKTDDLLNQVDRALITPPELALVIIGGNDVTSRSRIAHSAAQLANQVTRLIEAGATVVVGTCPDLGTVTPIPQPLREIAHRWSRALSRAQHRELARTGVVAVSLIDLVSPDFLARPGELFSADHFHPNGAGYEQAASVLLAPLCVAAGLVPGSVTLAA
jgi:lysophospholipase L1-like esterase